MGARAARGVFVTLEGVDGCGKSSKGSWLVRDLRAAGRACVATRDPGGTALSERVREILLDPENDAMSDSCELLLYEAARAQLADEVIAPALARGEVVVCDRFTDSTLAYQAFGRGIPEPDVRRANELGARGLVPDRTIVLDVPEEVSFGRATRGGADRMEGAGVALQARVRHGYLAIAAAEPERVRVVDASGSIERSYALMLEALVDVFPELAGALAAARAACAGEASQDG